jgi:hypothetical protein
MYNFFPYNISKYASIITIASLSIPSSHLIYFNIYFIINTSLYIFPFSILFFRSRSIQPIFPKYNKSLEFYGTTKLEKTENREKMAAVFNKNTN